jgi:hypothetical protein
MPLSLTILFSNTKLDSELGDMILLLTGLPTPNEHNGGGIGRRAIKQAAPYRAPA